jgi:hypothetical protein
MIVKLANLNVSGHEWIVLDVKRELLIFELLVCFPYERAGFPSDNTLKKYCFIRRKSIGGGGGGIIKHG